MLWPRPSLLLRSGSARSESSCPAAAFRSESILADLKRNLPLAQISARFHNALAEAIVAVAKRVGQERVVLSGGCFQNRSLTERSVQRLQEEGFRPYWHQRVPPNDGGISLGQVVAAQHQA